MSKNVKNQSKFVEVALIDIDKSDREKLTEAILDRLEIARIDCDNLISEYKTSIIPKQERAIILAERELKLAKTNFEKVRFKLDSTFEEYVNQRYRAEQEVFSKECVLESKKATLETLKGKLDRLVNVISVDLNS